MYYLVLCEVCISCSSATVMATVLIDGGRVIQDASGTTYRTVPMPTNGLCGFSCFSYSVTGDRYAYADVVEDSMRAFFRNPRLFLERTEFAKSNCNLSVYQRQMRDAVANVDFKPVPSPL